MYVPALQNRAPHQEGVVLDEVVLYYWISANRFRLRRRRGCTPAKHGSVAPITISIFSLAAYNPRIHETNTKIIKHFYENFNDYKSRKSENPEQNWIPQDDPKDPSDNVHRLFSFKV
jgi:hypothetical protein